MNASKLFSCLGLAACVSTPGALGLLSSGCQSTPDASASLNSRSIREVIVTDLYASPFSTVSKSEFRASEQQQIIVRGYGGQAVTLELWESRRGLLSHVTQEIPRDRVETRAAGVQWSNRSGNLEPVRRVETTARMKDWIVPITEPLPRGQYEARVKVGGMVQNAATFIVR
jgi:hypothetical protein